MTSKVYIYMRARTINRARAKITISEHADVADRLSVTEI